MSHPGRVPLMAKAETVDERWTEVDDLIGGLLAPHEI